LRWKRATIGLSEFLVGLRTRLIAEHFGLPVERVEAGLEDCDGRIRTVIECLRGEYGRTLCVLEGKELDDTEKALAKSRVLDPEDPIEPSRRLADFATNLVSRHHGTIAAGGMLAAGLAAWRMPGRR